MVQCTDDQLYMFTENWIKWIRHSDAFHKQHSTITISHIKKNHHVR